MAEPWRLTARTGGFLYAVAPLLSAVRTPGGAALRSTVRAEKCTSEGLLPRTSEGCTKFGADKRSSPPERLRVPTEPLPDWVLQQRRRVGERVRELREARDLSQERLGELAGLDRKTIYRVELAQYGTSIDHLALIARALGVEIVALFS